MAKCDAVSPLVLEILIVHQKQTQGFKSWLQNSVHNIISFLQ